MKIWPGEVARPFFFCAAENTTSSRRTPAAVLVRGTRPDALCRAGRLDGLAELAARAGEGPGLLVVGPTVARSDAWRALINAGARAEVAA